jgi:hypothetical protein
LRDDAEDDEEEELRRSPSRARDEEEEDDEELLRRSLPEPELLRRAESPLPASTESPACFLAAGPVVLVVTRFLGGGALYRGSTSAHAHCFFFLKLFRRIRPKFFLSI